MRGILRASIIPSILIFSTIIAVIGLGFALSIENSSVELTTFSENTEAKIHVDKEFGKVPLAFEVNQGQVDESVKFLTRGSGYTMFLTPQEAVISLASVNDVSQTIKMKMVGANSSPNVIGLDKLSSKTNYLISDNQENWFTNISNYAKVQYENIYPGIDLIYYGNQRQLEYDFIVNPGAEPSTIRIDFDVDELALDEQGNLILQIQDGKIIQHAPMIYQMINDQKQTVSGNYFITEKNIVEFEIGTYDLEIPLIIDPILSYSTYLGGSGSERGVDIAVDSSGNAYVTGGTNSIDFPTVNPIQPFNNGDAFVTKINSAGDAIVYSTYLGGSGFDGAQSIAVDSSGNAYVTGDTNSIDFPTVNAIQPLFAGGSEVFVTKINSAGDALVYSTYLGGSNQEERSRIAADSSGNAYVTGITRSSDFPLVNPIQPLNSGFVDTFVTKIDPAGTALYSTYLGGSNGAVSNGIAADSSGNAYVTGETSSSDFPTVNPIQLFDGGRNGFVTKINSAGTALVYSTYLGGLDRGILDPSIAVDSSGNAYVSGFTEADDFPLVNPIQTDNSGAGTWFVTKINSAGTALVYSTHLSSFEAGELSPTDIAVDSSGNAYFIGTTDSDDFPLVNPIQPFTGSSDFVVAKINPAGTALVYSTYLGGSEQEETERGIAVDSAGNAYVTGGSESIDFPTVNPIQPLFAGTEDVVVSKISDSTDTDGDGITDDIEEALTGDPIGLDVILNGLVASADLSIDAGEITIDGSDGSGNPLFSIVLPPGTTSSGQITLNYQTPGSISFTVISGVVIPYPPGKTITFAVNSGADQVCIIDRSTLAGVISPLAFCPDNPSISIVNMACPASPAIETRLSIGPFPELPILRDYTCQTFDVGPQRFMTITGLAFSEVDEFVDEDGDSLQDQCLDGFEDECGIEIIDFDVDGNLKVNEGEIVVIRGATIDGNIKNDGGTVIIREGSTIDGNVVSKNGGNVVIFGSTVDGNVKSKGAFTKIYQGSIINGNVNSQNEQTVIVLDSTVDGNLRVESVGTVEISGNTIDKNLRVKDSGTVTLTNNVVEGHLRSFDNTQTTVTGNQVTGNLNTRGTDTVTTNNNNVGGNLRAADSSSVDISDNVVGENLRVKNSSNVTIEQNQVGKNLRVLGNNEVSVTNNTVEKNLKIKGTSGTCTDTGNTVSGKFDGCP